MTKKTNNTKINIKDSIVIKKSSIPKSIERALRGRSRTHVKNLYDLEIYINFINMVISTNTQFSENTILQSISLLIKVSVFRLNEVISNKFYNILITNLITITIKVEENTSEDFERKQQSSNCFDHK